MSKPVQPISTSNENMNEMIERAIYVFRPDDWLLVRDKFTVPTSLEVELRPVFKVEIGRLIRNGGVSSA